MRGLARGHRAALRVERRGQGGEPGEAGVGADRFVPVHRDQRAVLVVTVNGDDFAGEFSGLARAVGELVRTQAQLVLILPGDAVQQRQVFGGHTHHTRGPGHVQTQARIHVHVVHHGQVAQVFHTAHQIHVAQPRADVRGRGVQGGHGRAAQAIHGLGGNRKGQLGAEHQQARQVHTLLAALQHTAPDQVVNLGGVESIVARQQPFDDAHGQVVGAHVAKTALPGAAHGAARVVDDHRISCLYSHIRSPAQ